MINILHLIPKLKEFLDNINAACNNHSSVAYAPFPRCTAMIGPCLNIYVEERKNNPSTPVYYLDDFSKDKLVGIAMIYEHGQFWSIIFLFVRVMSLV